MKLYEAVLWIVAMTLVAAWLIHVVS